MIRTHILRARIQRQLADALNQESGRIYTEVMVEHWRIYRKHGIWLHRHQAQKLHDCYDRQSSPLLTAHSIDAAQEGFYIACQTIRALKRKGDTEAHYPWRRKFWRTTIWKNTGIRLRDGYLLLSLARGREPIKVRLPGRLSYYDQSAFKEVRLVFNPKSQRYDWHLVIDNGQEPPDRSDWTNVAAVDLGEIHPAVVSDPTQAVVFSARELRATVQYRNKQLAHLSALQSSCQKRSRRWQRLQKRRNQVRGLTRRKAQDICHKVSRALVDWAVAQQVGTLVIGDVRDVADGKRLNRKSQQKVSQWTHGLLRRYITYKAEAEGIRIVLQEETYTSQTCPKCRERYKPRGRLYACSACGFTGHRDAVGAGNILSKYLFGELGGLYAKTIHYHRPFVIQRMAKVQKYRGSGHVVRPDTAQVACGA